MRLEPPGWWYGSKPSDRLKTALLAPAGFVYGAAVKLRFALTRPYRSPLPVICVGNFTVGGAGKTPLALALAAIIGGMGRKPAFLTRGYGGRLAGPHRVDPDRDEASDVGDEALLLARAAPTVLSRDRPAGAKAIEALGADVIIMDDGFQTPSLVKDLALIAVDAGTGLGNGHVFPAGPLRATLAFQRARAHTVVVIGDRANAPGLPQGVIPIIEARLRPSGDTAWLRARPILAFSGIGRPNKFFDTLRENGAKLIEASAFPDHHMFTEDEARTLIAKADEASAALVTTEKDWVRIPPLPGPLARLKTAASPLPVRLELTEAGEQRLRERLTPLLANAPGMASSQAE